MNKYLFGKLFRNMLGKRSLKIIIALDLVISFQESYFEEIN